MRILGIDPGVERTGYAFFEKKQSGQVKLLISGLIKTEKSISHEKRLFLIYKDLKNLISQYKPQVIVLEKLFLFKNQKTVIQVAQAQGVTLILGAKHQIPVVFLTPLEIKTIVTGYGRSDKKNVQKMLKISLNLTKNIDQDDEADAVAAAYAYCCLNNKLS